MFSSRIWKDPNHQIQYFSNIFGFKCAHGFPPRNSLNVAVAGSIAIFEIVPRYKFSNFVSFFKHFQHTTFPALVIHSGELKLSAFVVFKAVYPLIKGATETAMIRAETALRFSLQRLNWPMLAGKGNAGQCGHRKENIELGRPRSRGVADILSMVESHTTMAALTGDL